MTLRRTNACLLGIARLTIAIAVLASPVGCDTRSSSAQVDPNLRTVAGLYADFLRQNSGRAPRDRDEFRSFIGEHGASRLKAAGVSDIDALFSSTRDGQPLVIFYESNQNALAAQGIIGHEAVGIDGFRTVAYRFGTAGLLEESKLAGPVQAK
jgi:hypothetical protein